MVPSLLAARYDLAALNGSSNVMAALNVTGSIEWANDAWFDFGATNGARPEAIALGTNYFAAIHGPDGLRLTQEVAQSLMTMRPFSFDYECFSGGYSRVFRLLGLPLDVTRVLFVHSLRVAQAPEEPTHFPDATRYLGSSGILHSCSYCKRFRRLDGSAWDWIPAWVVSPPASVSHGCCAVCEGFYWGYIAPVRVLVMSDLDFERAALTRSVWSINGEVSPVRGLDEARRELETNAFDALIVDQQIRPEVVNDFLTEVRRTHPGLRCIVIDGSPQLAERGDEIICVTRSSMANELPRILSAHR
jgi:hypothetical protein